MQLPWVPSLVVNTFACLVLLTLWGDSRQRWRLYRTPDQWLFISMLFLNMALLVLDSGTWLLNGRQFDGARALNLMVTVGYYSLTPCMAFLYAWYCELRIGTPDALRRKLVFLYAVPVVFNAILTLLSPRYSFLFHLSPQNTYSRGSLLALNFIFSNASLFIIFFRLLLYIRQSRHNRYRLPPGYSLRRSWSLLVFPILPLLAVLLQIFWFNMVTTVWLATVLSLLVVFINLQNAEISTDPLTGLFNRRKADVYLQHLVQVSASDCPIFLVILDMDHFKQINDLYGHLSGDNGLRALAEAMRQSCGKNDFYSRYGGDEFLIISTGNNEVYLETLLQNIRQRLSDYCQALHLPYTLTISAGYAQWNTAMATADTLFTAADEALYRQKASRRSTEPAL